MTIEWRRRVVAVAALAGAGLLGTSLSVPPDSAKFYGLTLGTATTWTVGGLASGPLHLGRARSHGRTPYRPILAPISTGVVAFGVFYGCALVARLIPILNEAISNVLQYANQGSTPPVLFTTLMNGAAEEVFFRGAVYAAAGEHPVAVSTGIYCLVTSATRNPALVLASGVMGALFGLQRRATGGIQAPMLTHLTWSTLMICSLPSLFPDHSGEGRQ
jgi:membrane protease YdiL (CAAX protease family)